MQPGVERCLGLEQ